MSTHTSTAAVTTVSARQTIGVSSKTVSHTFSGTAASAGDVVQMIKVAAGTTPLAIYIAGGPATSTFGSTITVGDGIDPNRYLATTSASDGMTIVHCNALAGALYTYTADDTIDITISAIGSATAAGTFYLNAIYTDDV